MYKKFRLQRGDSQNNEIKDSSQKIDYQIDQDDQDILEEYHEMNFNEFEEQMRNQVEFSPLNKSEDAIDSEYLEKENNTSFDLQKVRGKQKIHTHKQKISKFEMPTETFESELKPFILEESEKVKFSNKYQNLRQFVDELKFEHGSVLTYVKRKFQQFSLQISENMKKTEIAVNGFIYFSESKKNPEIIALEERARQQEIIINDLKSVTQSINSLPKTHHLQKKLANSQSQLEKALIKIKQLQAIILELEAENNQLQQEKFDFQQKIEQFDLQVERKIAEKKEKSNIQSLVKQNYLNQIRSLEEQIEKMSEKCIQSQYNLHERQQYLKEKENQLIARENNIQQQYGKLQLREIELQRNIERSKIKESQLTALQENLYKKIEDVQLRENQLYSRKIPVKREEYKPGCDKKSEEDQRQEFFLHGKCFNSRPASGFKNRDRHFAGKKSRATLDIDALSNGSKVKDNLIRTRIGLQDNSGRNIHRSPGQGNKLNNLSSKLQRLRNQIRKQIQSVQ